MKLYEGMKVRIKVGFNCIHGTNTRMRAMEGEIVTIDWCESEHNIRLKEDDGDFIWDADCFESLEEEGNKVETIMVKESSFELENEKREDWINEAITLLENYDYPWSRDALTEIFDEWAKQKGWLVDLFRKSEYYNGNGQIVIPANLKRPVNKDDVKAFVTWARTEYRKMMTKYELMVGLHSLYEYCEARDKTYSIYREVKEGAIYKGLTKEGWYAEWRRMEARADEALAEYDYVNFIVDGREIYIDREYRLKAERFEQILRIALQLSGDYNDEIPNILGEKRTKDINGYCEMCGYKARAIEGQKVTKFVGKLLKELGMNHIVDIKEILFIDANGNTVTRTKDMGYNYYFALLGDAINPIEYSREVVISVNPFDYWTMSFGYKWASCHTIDKENRRGVGSNDYQGCYSGGTEAYMLDNSSVIVYVRPTEDEIKGQYEQSLPMELQSKLKRCVFYIGEDKIAQGRVYPDGRDGGDEGLAAQLRAIMQKTISELYNTPNMWTLKKGTSACLEAITTVKQIHYPDYTHYDDCNVSYLRRINGDLNHNKIKVGARYIICPACGDEHDAQEHITCDCCYNDEDYNICRNCGERTREENGFWIDDCFYCCPSCAESDGACWCVDADEWGWKENSYYDSYEGEWYAYSDEGIYVDDGWYHDSETAKRAGYRYASIDEKWAREDDIVVTPNGDTFIKNNYDDAVETPDGWYTSTDEAGADGWMLDDDGNLVREVA